MRTRLAISVLAPPLALFTACGGGETATTSSTGMPTGSASSSGAGAGAGGCGAPNTQLDGTLDGAPVGEAFFSDSTTFSDEGELSVSSAEACGCGMFLLTPTAPPADGGAEPFTGLFRMPGAWPQPGGGGWFCAAEGSATNELSPDVDFTLASLSRLGSCPAKPTNGSVFGCVGVQGSAACEDGADSSLVSTLFGATFAWDDVARGYVGGDRVEVLTALPSDNAAGAGSRLYLELDAPAHGGAAVVTGGVLLIGPGGPDPGGVYCVGGGALTEGAPRRFTLTGLSRLGACGDAPISGSLTGRKKG